MTTAILTLLPPTGNESYIWSDFKSCPVCSQCVYNFQSKHSLLRVSLNTSTDLLKFSYTILYYRKFTITQWFLILLDNFQTLSFLFWTCSGSADCFVSESPLTMFNEKTTDNRRIATLVTKLKAKLAIKNSILCLVLINKCWHVKSSPAFW